MKIEKFIYEGSEISFDITSKEDTMVNATEMAKKFGKDVYGFLRNDDVKNFIDAFCQTENLRFENEFSPAGKLVKVIKGHHSVNGTWMHRAVAIKFAAWLNPFFEVWVYKTINKILYEFAHEIEDSINESILLQREQDAIKNKLAKESPEFLQYLTIEQKKINSRTRRRTATKNKFKEVEDLFSKGKEEDFND